MRHKISKFSLIIFLFSNNFKLFGNPCDEFGCLCCCNDKIENDKIEAALMEKLNEKYSKSVENININVLMDDLKEDCKNYIVNEINNSNLAMSDKNIGEKEEIKNYEFQTNVLRDFVEHYKNSKEVLPNYFFYVLDILLKISISNEDLINIMKKELDYETKKEQLEYIDIDRIVEVENIEEMADKKKRYILREEGAAIERDLHRTFPNVEFFNDPENLNIFQKILYNFISQLYKSGINTGYCQGMSFYTGFFLILCEKEDPSGKLAFELLYLFMTKEWWVNDYITGTVIIDKGNYENPNNVEKRYEKKKYSIISFYMGEHLIIRSINNKLCDNMTFLEEDTIEYLKQNLFLSIKLLFGLVNLNINLIRKIFFLILLVKNCKIFFDIANFAVNVFPPLNNKKDYELVIYYNNDLFPEFVKRYTK